MTPVAAAILVAIFGCYAVGLVFALAVFVKELNGVGYAHES